MDLTIVTHGLTNNSRIILGHNGDMENVQGNQHPSWAKDGSYFVFRKLKQYVPEFNK